MRLREAGSPPARDHDVADQPVETERAHFRALRRKAAVGDDADRDAFGRAREIPARIRAQAHPGIVRPVDREEFAHDPPPRPHAAVGQGAIEDEAPFAGLESLPRGAEEPSHREPAADEFADGAESASNVVALEEQRVVEVEHHQPFHIGSIRSGATCRPMISMS